MIVGVVGDAKHASVRDPASATVYRPFGATIQFIRLSR